MTHKSKAVPPFMGQEIEWAILVRELNGEYCLPYDSELVLMINVFRKLLKYPLADSKTLFENTFNLVNDIDWRRFLRKAKRSQLHSDHGLLPCGGRYYIDATHLEFSTPGCTNLKDLIISDKAAEKILNFSREALQKKVLSPGCEVKVFKDTSNRKGTTFAGHENYLINEETFRKLTYRITKKTMQLASFLAVRVPLCAAGNIVMNGHRRLSFQISQRAQWIREIKSLHTTKQRPLINTRDEPHADFVEQDGKEIPVRRLHIICGEPNMSPAAIKMRFGTTMNFLLGLQDDIFNSIQKDIVLKDPVKAVKIISGDVKCKRTVELADGRRVKFYEILRIINDRLRWYFKEIREPTAEQMDVLEKVEYYCDAFERGSDYYMKMLLPELDWINRFDVCDSAFKKGEKWSNFSIETLEQLYYNDLTYADIDPKISLYYEREKIYKEEGLIKEEVTEKEINHRVFYPPDDSREYLRGELLRRFPGAYTDWEVVVLPSRNVLWLGDPFRGSKSEIGDLVKNCPEDVLVKKFKSMGFKISNFGR